MIEQFEIVGSQSVRPKAERIIFCDGTGSKFFHADMDLELSHWRPNRTLAEYRAGTSTEICFKFLDKPRPGNWTVAVNNHVDVDGILSVYVLVHSEHALAHRCTIVEAAEMGDFWSWGEPPAQRLFQGLTQLMNSIEQGRGIYTEAFRRIPSMIDGTAPEIPFVDASLAPLRRGIEFVEQRRIARSLIASRLAHYVIPATIAGDDEQASYVPDFNEAISEKMAVWPHVRARWDAERVCLVSTERRSGWFHDLYFPGYHWADTEGLWRVPGLTYHDGMRSYELANPQLIAVYERLQQQESAAGQWSLGGTKLPFGNEIQQRFPLVGRFLDENQQAAVSNLSPERVATEFVNVFS